MVGFEVNTGAQFFNRAVQFKTTVKGVGIASVSCIDNMD